ncbi:putative CRISPR-associated protein [Vibrio halioticoli NBRC 102217]|uniref:Putative CRISPR-associated protein n=1 Tax=Vibrio halioticoli NBRC 102217 TaxID=1219072 RepID=V5FMA4_9VIBR|nr:type I-E CRISPR-associated protein Cas6/Cse3/CasE [Vibrio halioticoli]GAD89982.1 putative CRISPR-associated protein [Vibrio halioticoli NBRC 102217]
MYISMVTLDVTDTYDQHQAIWSLFPDAPDRKRDHLFRIENKNGRQLVALLQSTSQPMSSKSAKVLKSKVFNPVITNGDYFKFKLTANPTKCLSEGKKVVELKTEAQQVEWLQRKLNGANVTVTSIDSHVTNSRKSSHSRFVTFEGVLQVINSEQVYSALVMGIGRKKHAGAGLLSLAKVN